MLIKTLQFGEIEIEENNVIHFPNGLPGFEELRQFTLIHPQQDIPFSFLQSVESEHVSFLVTNPFHFYPDYEFDLSDTVQSELQILNEEEITIWSIVTIRENLAKATINLIAPVIINTTRKMGRQIILHETDYTTQHLLLSEQDRLEIASGGKESC